MRNIYYVDPKMSDINDFGKIFWKNLKPWQKFWENLKPWQKEIK